MLLISILMCVIVFAALRQSQFANALMSGTITAVCYLGVFLFVTTTLVRSLRR